MVVESRSVKGCQNEPVEHGIKEGTIRSTDLVGRMATQAL
jgi:hypothetical protein